MSNIDLEFDEAILSDSEAEESEEEEVELLAKNLPKRSTRGKKTEKSKLETTEEEEEADEQFWEQKAWAELSDDDVIGEDEYDSNELGDSSDSDIDLDENEIEEQNDEKLLLEREKRLRRKQKKQSNVYVDPILAKKQQKIKKQRTIIRKERDMKTDRELRHSTTTTTEVTELRKQEYEREQKTRQRQKPKKRKRVVQLTQQELLEEAAKTEIENKQSLERLLLLQAEKKKKVLAKEVIKGPKITYKSKRVYEEMDSDEEEELEDDNTKSNAVAINSLTFSDVNMYKETFNFNNIKQKLQNKNKKQQLKCVVTGQRAKYIDPLTKCPYATSAAFKIIRQQQKQQQN